MKTDNKSNNAYYIALIFLLSAISFGRTIVLNDVAWDDNCWLISIYSTDSLEGFLNTGFHEMRRVPMGVFYYYYYLVHKLTDYAFPIWNTINMLLQIASPILIYMLVRRVWKNDLLALLSAISFVLCPIDTTLPYYANIAYRLGTMLCILSFYLTALAIEGKTRWPMIIGALIAQIISAYVLLEASIMLEPARMLLIGYLIWRKNEGMGKGPLIAKIISMESIFALACVPLLIFRVLYKPYGIYGSTYTMNYLFFLNIKMHIKVIRHFMFYNWFIFIKHISWTSIVSIAAAVIAAAGVILSVPKMMTNENNSGRFYENLKNHAMLILIAAALMLFPVMLYEFSGRVPSRGMEGRHGTILLFGYSMFFGVFLYAFLKSVSRKTAVVLLSAFIVFGVFFNNVNLDLYKKGEEYQKAFWIKFTERFPSIPDNTPLFIDAAMGSPYYNSDLEAYYELEFPLNMLYATSTDPANFRNHPVYASSEGIKDDWRNQGHLAFTRIGHGGEDVFDTSNTIFVYYRGGEVYVNSEILSQYPDAPYKMWLDRPAPVSSGKARDYPLRGRMPGFY